MYDDLFKDPLSPLEEKYRAKIQAEIISCYNCQPYDDGEPVWINGERTEIEALFYKYKVDENYWTNIIDHLVCPCGTEVTDGGDIGIRSKYEIDIDNFVKNSNKKFLAKIKSFIELLSDTPFLGYRHSIGKNTYNELKDGSFPVTFLSANDKFFRARKVNGHDIIQSSEMLNAPKGKPTEGRFNHAGQSHLYLANTKETAIKEVVYNFKNSLVWVQEFWLTNSVENILDLTFDITNLSLNTNPLFLALSFSNALEENKNNHEYWRPDYFLTRFIMDCAKQLEYNGIKYNSSRSPYDFNVVMFYSDNIKLKNIGSPKIEIFSSPQIEIFDN